MRRAQWILLLLGVAAVAFAGVAVHERAYKNSHPYAYGPAAVIAIVGFAGAALAVAVAWLVFELRREREHESESGRRERAEAHQAIRSRVDSGELTEHDYSEWFWDAGGDAHARTKLFLLEREVLSRLGNLEIAVRAHPEIAELLDALEEDDRDDALPTVDPSNDDEWRQHYD